MRWFSWLRFRRSTPDFHEEVAGLMKPLLGMPPFTGCVDCGCTQYYPGPEGGMAMNIECANPDCGSRFNIVLMPGGPYLDMRISEPRPKMKLSGDAR